MITIKTALRLSQLGAWTNKITQSLYVATAGACIVAGCDANHNSPSSGAQTTNAASTEFNSQGAAALLQPTGEQARAPWDPDAYQRKKDAALAAAQKADEERLNGTGAAEVPLPNYEPRPGLPLPLYRNFYEINPRYRTYLLCAYHVSENLYNQGNEPVWFEEALLQVRSAGPQIFPPINWIAVGIINRPDQKGSNALEQSFKAAAIFSASNAFDFAISLSNMVNRAEIDRHPFKYDAQQASPRDQRRWLIVERHAAQHPH